MLLILMAMCTDNNFCWEISKFTFKLESFEPRKITKLPFTTFKGWTSWNTSWNDWKSAAYCIFDHCFTFISVMLCCNAQISAENIFVNYRIPSVSQLCFDHKWIVRLNRIKETKTEISGLFARFFAWTIFYHGYFSVKIGHCKLYEIVL